MSRAKLYYLHEGLPRQAPGTDLSTIEAIQNIQPFPPGGRVLDIGCGPGRASILLAKELNARVTAIDIYQPYLDQLTASSKRNGVSQLIKPLKKSMDKLKFEPESINLIWAEGSAYFLGIRRSLEMWFPWLRERGLAMFSELCWLTNDRPSEAVEYWAKAYPEMTTSDAHMAAAREVGYYEYRRWILSEKDWWPEYLTPLEARMKLLAPEAAKDRKLAALIADSRRAIDLFRRHSRSFGYVFHVVGKPISAALQTSMDRFAIKPPGG